MNETILAYYDVTGIQDFIFSSNRLKDNIGASEIVWRVFNTYLIDCIKEKYPNSETDSLTEEIVNNFSVYDSVKIFIGGGNALIYFRNDDIAKEISKDLSKKLLELTAGQIKYVVVYQKVDFKDFSKDLKKLQIKMQKKKHSKVQTSPLLGIGITKSEQETGLPATIKEKDKYISLSTKLKHDVVKLSDFKKKKDDLIKDIDNYQFTDDLGKLGQVEGENFIAVVHIDGDNMGQLIHDFIRNERVEVQDSNSDKLLYNRAILRYRELSDKIDLIYKETMKKMIQDLVDRLNDENNEFQLRKVKCLDDHTSQYLPIRPIVLNGDDITFVCNGKLAIGLTECFLKHLYETKLEVLGETIPHSASGGIAIVKTKFPFYRAYDLAEALCKSAKIKSKIIIKNQPDEDSRDYRSNWIDFQMIKASLSLNLTDLRSSLYNIQGGKPPEELNEIKKSKTGLKQKQYNLLWRPWFVAGKSPEEFNFKYFKDFYEKFKSRKWPRSKLKNLQENFQVSEGAVIQYLNELESRDLKFPSFQNSLDPFRNRQTPYFDALELQGYYFPIYIDREERS